jgi:hypothetical protein
VCRRILSLAQALTTTNNTTTATTTTTTATTTNTTTTTAVAVAAACFFPRAHGSTAEPKTHLFKAAAVACPTFSSSSSIATIITIASTAKQ